MDGTWVDFRGRKPAVRKFEVPPLRRPLRSRRVAMSLRSHVRTGAHSQARPCPRCTHGPSGCAIGESTAIGRTIRSMPIARRDPDCRSALPSVRPARKGAPAELVGQRVLKSPETPDESLDAFRQVWIVGERSCPRRGHDGRKESPIGGLQIAAFLAPNTRKEAQASELARRHSRTRSAAASA